MSCKTTFKLRGCFDVQYTIDSKCKKSITLNRGDTATPAFGIELKTDDYLSRPGVSFQDYSIGMCFQTAHSD